MPLPPDPRAAGLSAHETDELRELLQESAKRRIESLKLYEPLPYQEAYHRCTAKECLIQKGNQTGGSLCGFAEVARAVTGQDPYGKYPQRDGTAVALGYGEKHIGRVIHQYLFKAGAFCIIRDEQTGEWRTYRPWPPDQTFHGKPGDKHREAEKKPAPPLIPGRFIVGGYEKGISWEKKSEKVFSRVEFTTGWLLYAMNSAGEPGQAQGFQADLYDIDEDVATSGWYDEALGRLVTRGGKLRWHALPHAKTDDIVSMIEAAEKDRSSEHPTTVCLRATMFDNPFIDSESREATIKRYKAQGEDVYRKRVLGELTTDKVLMYPTFNESVHDALRKDEPQLNVQKALVESNGEPPADWCRYFVVDPGHTTCAVLFLSVPPPELGDHVVCYDELYIEKCDAEIFGAKVEEKAKDKHWQEFIIDAHGGRLRELGSGITPQRQYEKQLQKRGILSDAGDYHFRNGSDDVKGREQMLREWLYVRTGGTPKLLISVERCPNTVWELSRFKKKQTPQGHVLDEGNRRMPCHAVECLEYAAAHGMPYVKPTGRVRKVTWAGRIIAERRMRDMQRHARGMHAGQTYHNLGPQGANV